MTESCEACTGSWNKWPHAAKWPLSTCEHSFTPNGSLFMSMVCLSGCVSCRRKERDLNFFLSCPHHRWGRQPVSPGHQAPLAEQTLPAGAQRWRRVQTGTGLRPNTPGVSLQDDFRRVRQRQLWAVRAETIRASCQNRLTLPAGGGQLHCDHHLHMGRVLQPPGAEPRRGCVAGGWGRIGRGEEEAEEEEGGAPGSPIKGGLCGRGEGAGGEQAGAAGAVLQLRGDSSTRRDPEPVQDGELWWRRGDGSRRGGSDGRLRSFPRGSRQRVEPRRDPVQGSRHRPRRGGSGVGPWRSGAGVHEVRGQVYVHQEEAPLPRLWEGEQKKKNMSSFKCRAWTRVSLCDVCVPPGLLCTLLQSEIQTHTSGWQRGKSLHLLPFNPHQKWAFLFFLSFFLSFFFFADSF